MQIEKIVAPQLINLRNTSDFRQNGIDIFLSVPHVPPSRAEGRKQTCWTSQILMNVPDFLCVSHVSRTGH